jgi:hypothetical protein
MANSNFILARHFASVAMLDASLDFPYLAKHYARLAVRRARLHLSQYTFEVCAIRRYRRCMLGAIYLGRADIAAMYARDIVSVARRVYPTPTPGEIAHTLTDILPTNTEA